MFRKSSLNSFQANISISSSKCDSGIFVSTITAEPIQITEEMQDRFITFTDDNIPANCNLNSDEKSKTSPGIIAAIVVAVVVVVVVVIVVVIIVIKKRKANHSSQEGNAEEA